MTKREMYSFITRKGELVLALVGDHDPSVGQMVAMARATLAVREWPEESYIHMDREIDDLIRHQSSAVVENVERTLRKEFGFARLGETPKRVMAKVLKRGSAKSGEEASVVRDALAGDLGELPAETLDKLSKIMRKFEDDGPR